MAILSTLTGPNLPATMETAEVHLVPGLRAFVNEVYPLDDAASDAPGSIAERHPRNAADRGAPFWSPPVTDRAGGGLGLRHDLGAAASLPPLDPVGLGLDPCPGRGGQRAAGR